MTGWGPKILVVCCPEAEAMAREDGYEVADTPGQNRRRTQAWTWSSIARTNLCTTRTRPGRDLSVTWPSQGTFPGSHRSARGPALPARCSCPDDPREVLETGIEAHARGLQAPYAPYELDLVVLPRYRPAVECSSFRPLRPGDVRRGREAPAEGRGSLGLHSPANYQAETSL